MADEIVERPEPLRIPTEGGWGIVFHSGFSCGDIENGVMVRFGRPNGEIQGGEVMSSTSLQVLRDWIDKHLACPAEYDPENDIDEDEDDQ